MSGVLETAQGVLNKVPTGVGARFDPAQFDKAVNTIANIPLGTKAKDFLSKDDITMSSEAADAIDTSEPSSIVKSGLVEGTKKFPDGSMYFGEMRDGKANGQGLLNWPNSGEKYFGDFIDDKRHGKGTMTYANNKKYVGPFKDGKESGEGMTTWPDGTTYAGDFSQNGLGTKTSLDGSTMKGAFVNGKA